MFHNFFVKKAFFRLQKLQEKFSLHKDKTDEEKISSSLIIFKNVSVCFERDFILKNLTLSLHEKRVAVIGANGSGKSTFSRLLNGLILPSNGQVSVDGLDTRSDSKIIRRKLGFVFQNPDNQIIMPTVEEDLAFGMKNLKIDKEKIECKIEEILHRYGLSDQRKKVANRLSGGQKQLLALCSVLVMNPEIIVLDEPTATLDLLNKKRIIEIIENLSQRVIMITHDLSLLKNFERVLVFDSGYLVYDAFPAEAISFYEKLIDGKRN